MEKVIQQRRFVFKKEYNDKMGKLPVGSQLDIIQGLIYFNGYLCDQYSSQMFDYILNTPSVREEYLRETPIPYNKV